MHQRRHSTHVALLAKKQTERIFSTALLSLRHLERLFPVSPLQYQVLAARVVQDKVCEKMPGGEVGGTVEDAEGRGQGEQNYRRMWEAREAKLNRVRWDVREDFCSCFWTNQEHRSVSGHWCLQRGNDLFCR